MCFSIQINGEASSHFSSLRGLTQGDPLQPLWFILVMEKLSKLVNNAVKEGLLDAFHNSNPRSDGLLISYLLFADDTLSFCKPNESKLGYLRCIILLFEAVSGLRVNLSKSHHSHCQVPNGLGPLL